MCAPNADEFYVFDRKEGELFVLAGDSGREMAVDLLPEGARAGDVLRRGPEGWVLCPDETAARRARTGEKKRALFRRGRSQEGGKTI